MQEKYMHIPKEKFEFANSNADIHDEKLKTKARGYFADAMIRFKKNKSSVVAAFIILILVLFSIFSPIISPYTMDDKAKEYENYPPFVEGVADLGIGILDGSTNFKGKSISTILALQGIAAETGRNPIIGKVTEHVYEVKEKNQIVKKYVYDVTVNRYYQYGVKYEEFSKQEYDNILAWQEQTGKQIIYPMVDKYKVYETLTEKEKEDIKFYATDFRIGSNIWYRCDKNSYPLLDASGNFVTAYATDANGNYIYGTELKAGTVSCRIDYYNYYEYKFGLTPTYLFGTDNYGRDLFCAIGMGARFSLIFAVLVSIINLTIGAIYGAIQGYYGGIIDLTMDRVSDILSGVPFMVVATLFNLHLAAKVGVVPSFLFAFVLTGWIGMAALTRKQFYRFKNQEYVMAARTLGASDKRIMFKHILPNAIGTMVTSCALVIPSVILSETNLTYLNIINLSSFVGTSVGELMSSGQKVLSSAPHAMFFPAIFFSLLLISFNLFGNGLRDAFNPSTRGVDD